MSLNWIIIIALILKCIALVSTAPWGVLQGDEVMNDPSACREVLRGVQTPFETAHTHDLSPQNLQSQRASMLVRGSIVANAIMEDYNSLARKEEETIWLRAEAKAMMKTAQTAEESLEKEKAAFEKLKQTERWAASAGLEQNERLFRACQELNNLKAANAALVKEKSAVEATIKEAKTRGATALKEAEVRAAKELADTNVGPTKLNKVAELKAREGILQEVISRATEAETWASQAEEARDGLATSLA
ncbi:hypothetical protein Hanom_Chr06g00546611 [Helianthus anomalus]